MSPPLTMGQQLDKQIQISMWPYIVRKWEERILLRLLFLEPSIKYQTTEDPVIYLIIVVQDNATQIYSWENINYQSLTQLQSAKELDGLEREFAYLRNN